MPLLRARWFLVGVLCLSGSFAMSSQEPTPNKQKEASVSQANSATPQSPAPSWWSDRIARMETHKPAVETIKATVEIIAYLSALVFFLFKVFGGGYLTANVAMNITCNRQMVPRPPGEDYLTVNVTVKKGATRTIKLLCGAIRVRELGSGRFVEKALELKRVDYDRDRILKGDCSGINWPGVRRGYEFLYMPPGDESQFASVLRVHNGEPCQVDVLIFGQSKLFKIKVSEWRASTISLPV
jgi:hypothetical protein